MNTLYIYPKKFKLFALAAFSFLMSCFSIYRVYEILTDSSVSMLEGFILLLCIPLFIMGTVHMVSQLLCKDYLYAFTKEGIIDYKGRFFPWSEIKEIKKQSVRAKGHTNNYMIITFKKPYVRFSRYPWLLPKKEIMFDISLYQADGIDAFYGDSLTIQHK